MSILDDDSNADVISWLPEGKGFIILDKKQFAEEVMPRYFNDTKFASFIRRLNRWCFIHRPKGNCQSQYFHPWFLKGDLHKCLQIRPKPQVSYKKKKKSAEESQEKHEALFSSQEGMMMPQQGSLGQGQMGQFMQSGLQNSMSAAAANVMHQNNLYPTFPHASNFNSASLMPSHGLGHNQQMAASHIAGYAPVGFTLPTPQANPQYPQYILQGGANAMPQLNFSQPPMQHIMNLPETHMPGLPSEQPMNNNAMFNNSLRNPYDMRGMQQINREQQFQPNKNNHSQNNDMQNLQMMANHPQFPVHSSPARGGAQYQEQNPQDRHNP